jgi:hypothetical protein
MVAVTARQDRQEMPYDPSETSSPVFCFANRRLKSGVCSGCLLQAWDKIVRYEIVRRSVGKIVANQRLNAGRLQFFSGVTPPKPYLALLRPTSLAGGAKPEKGKSADKWKVEQFTLKHQPSKIGSTY